MGTLDYVNKNIYIQQGTDNHIYRKGALLNIQSDATLKVESALTLTPPDNTYMMDFEGMTKGASNVISLAGNEPTWTGKTYQIKCKDTDGSDIFLVAVKP